MLNCDAGTTEASAWDSVIGYPEAKMIHQKSLQQKHGLVTGFRLDLERTETLGKTDSSGQGLFLGKFLTVNNGKEHSGSWRMSASISVKTW